MAIELRLYAAMQIVDHPETLPKAGDNDVGWFRFAICDLERLDGESGNATGRSGMSSGGAPWLELEGMITDGVREVECLQAIGETNDFAAFAASGVRHTAFPWLTGTLGPPERRVRTIPTRR